MKNYKQYFFLVLIIALASLGLRAQNKSDGQIQMADSVFTGLKLRSIGPAFMSGRIADIAIHPEDENTWYVAVGSGGVWKTVNAGVTWTPIFDDQSSYSIGCVTVDPNNPHTVWVGTGENVGGRHVGYGDGIYKSMDGGKHWKNMGLEASEHISKIMVHPENSDVVWVAAQGPLWKKGGERGLYKTTDGGKTWKKTLGDNVWTGVTDILIDPRNPDVLYAATWDRHRNVAAYLGGGPGTGIHKSTDGGETWMELTEGLPEDYMAKIGLAISQQNPDIVYAAIELDRRTGGVYRSADGGMTWGKQSDAVAGATGPHYYQELYASPHHLDRLYLVDNHMQYSTDGGKTFKRLNNAHKHGDNHAIAFKKSDPDYLLVGTDGGVYESFDLGDHWRFMENLPVTQFYKVAVDDAEPFYNIYGGTQDNSTQGGPSRTDNVHGIQNSDWRVILNWDGHQPATEPGNPNIMYGERQEGNISRIDLTTGEVVDIQPQPGPDEGPERFNWDAPILVSPHQPSRIYFASQRVWRSDNRGDKWEAISGDLTRNQNRIELPIMDRKPSWDNAWDFLAMSNYNTITSLAESPLQEGLIYAGTDDGLIQVTENGGESWRKIEVGSLPGVPSTAFVNDIKADLHDLNTVYVALDNHKFGDFAPYLLKSTDRGKSWTSIKGNIPDRTLVWRVVQDHVKPGLMFAATEFGIYFTVDGGTKWTKLEGGVPTISFRDLAIQKRENDLIGASFGRGFYVYDDYSALREVSESQLQEEATLFPVRKAWWYIPRSHLSFGDEKGSQGADHFVAPNPDFGALITYYLKDNMKTKEEMRQEKEKPLRKNMQDVPFPGWDNLAYEMNEKDPAVWIIITNGDGEVIRRISGPTESGFHRIAWDLRYPAPQAIDPASVDEEEEEEDGDEPAGLMVAPGTYYATLYSEKEGNMNKLSDAVEIKVEPLREGVLEGAPDDVVAGFWRDYEGLVSRSSALNLELSKGMQKYKALELALKRAQATPGELDNRLFALRDRLKKLDHDLNGNVAKRQVGEKTMPTVAERIFAINRGITHSTYGPTDTHKETYTIVVEELNALKGEIASIEEGLSELADDLEAAGAPTVED